MKRSSGKHPQQGSVLGATLIFAVAVAIIVAGLVQWSGTEQKIALQNVGLAKARMTAESVGAYGEAQVIARLERLTYFPDDEFLPGHNPVSVDLAAPTNPNAWITALAPNGNTYVVKRFQAEMWGYTVMGTPILPSNVTSPSPSSTFRYEITPENLAVGRFNTARWVTVAPSNPLYDGDPLIDQKVRVREVSMVSAARAVDSIRGSSVRAFCQYRLQVRDVPVWGFVLFYNMDLEIAPGPAMEVHGPVHANGDMYVQSGDALRFHDMVTTAGQLHYGLIGGATNTGDVIFLKGGTISDYVSLYQDGAWLDSNMPGWTETASTLWAGNVRTKSHGTNKSKLPGMAAYIPDDPATGSDELVNAAYAIIEPALPDDNAAFPGNDVETQKFASKACLVVEVSSTGSASIYKYTADVTGKYIRNIGTGPQRFIRQQLSVPAGLIVGGTASDKFYDKRRAQWVFSADLDVGELKTLIETAGEAAAFTYGGVTFDPATEWNGVVYVDHKKTSTGGVRLVNGASVPDRATFANGYAKGFTLATNAPLYVQGNYNANGNIDSDSALIKQPDSVAEPPAGLAADAVTILSTHWSDANSNLALSNRIATQTEVAAALLLGLVPTNKNSNGLYSGGVENLPRFLENWSGVKLGYRGAMAVLYESERATEPWGSSDVYGAPIRVWGFNDLFAGGVLPPGTPNSRTYRRIGFRDITEAEYQAALSAIASS